MKISKRITRSLFAANDSVPGSVMKWLDGPPDGLIAEEGAGIRGELVTTGGRGETGERGVKEEDEVFARE